MNLSAAETFERRKPPEGTGIETAPAVPEKLREKDLRDAIDAETTTLQTDISNTETWSSDTLQNIDREATEISPDVADSRSETSAALSANSKAMRAALERANREADAELGEASKERLLAETEAAGRELLLAIERAFPERAERERERARIEEEMRGEIETIGELGEATATKPLLIYFEGKQRFAIYKPRRRETDARSGIPTGTFALCEWLAFQIDRALQLDIVPPTILRDGPEGLGSAQHWESGEPTIERETAAPTDQEDLMRVAALDVLIGNTDRHRKNYLIAPDGKVHAIDNGLIFPERADSENGLRSNPLKEVQLEDLSPELSRRLEEFQTSYNVRTALKKSFEIALGDKAEKFWNQFLARMDKLLTDGALPLAPEWPASPDAKETGEEKTQKEAETTKRERAARG